MEKRTILIQLDTDAQPSVFDRVVAVDAGADEIFSYGGVQPDQVQALVHGAIFTRGPKELALTALYIGGSDVSAAEKLLEEVQQHMLPQFGLRVSVLFDANGSNTTAAAAVRAASRHLELKDARALVLGGTGPVGQRVALLLAGQGAEVRLASRQQSRAMGVCDRLQQRVPGGKLQPVGTGSAEELQAALADRTLVIAAGAAGVVLLPKDVRAGVSTLKVAIDLNAVPPLGIEGVGVADQAAQQDGVTCYGAIGVGSTKMKIHLAAVNRLFQSNDQILDAEQVYALSEGM